MFCFFVLFCFLCRSSLLNSHNLPASSDHLRRSSSSAFFSFLSLSHPCWVKAYSWCWFFFFFTLFLKNLYHYVVTGLRSTSRQEATQPPSDWPMAGRTIQVCVWERERPFSHVWVSAGVYGNPYKLEVSLWIVFFFFYCYGQCWTLRKLWKVCKAPSSAVDFIYFFFKILYRFSMHVYIVMPCYVLVKCLRRGIKWVLTVFPCKDVHRVDDRIVSALHFPLLLWQF